MAFLIKCTPFTNKCAFVANVLLAFLFPFALGGQIESKFFDFTMFGIYLLLCIINRPNRDTRKSWLDMKQLIKDAKDPDRLIKRTVYCFGLYVVRFFLRIAMLALILCRLLLLILSWLPFISGHLNKGRLGAVFYVFLLSDLLLGIRVGGYFSAKLSNKAKIFLNISWLFASAVGLYLSIGEGLWKHFSSFGKLPACTLTCYFLTTLLFVQIGFAFYELTVGKETT